MSNEIIVQHSDEITSIGIDQELTQYDLALLCYLNECQLPTQDVLTTINERKRVFNNIPGVLEQMDNVSMQQNHYISKFIAAVSAGLFDAALNYLWDETIRQLRIRISNYDVEYFFDVAVGSDSDKRKNLHGEEDLCKLDDSVLLKGVRDIDLITEIGYRKLDYIKYMRNWASAAHPNQTEVTGLQLISWLETCIKEVITLPNSDVTLEIGRFLKNIKAYEYKEDELISFKEFTKNLTQERHDSLAEGLFGIFCRLETQEFTRSNIKHTFPILWGRIGEETRNKLGIKYARYKANGDVTEARYARELLNLVDGQAYLPEVIKVAELDKSLDNLYNAHHGKNNFYTEPSFAKEVYRLVGKNGIPKQVNDRFVSVVIDAYITNGNGICYAAEPVYEDMIKGFNQDQINISVLLILNESISSKLQVELCRSQFAKMIQIVKPNNTNPNTKEIIDIIENNEKFLSNIRTNMALLNKIKSYSFLLNKT